MILVTGATGHVGSRLLARLEDEGEAVRALTRNAERLHGKVAASTQVAQGDVLDRTAMRAALEGVGAAYYLVHSLGASQSFVEEDRRAAEIFATAAADAGVERIVYLGGLGEGDELSEHLTSRQEVGEILRSSGVLTIEFRASIIIGAGSLSFEMVRSLVDNLPALVLPNWVENLSQPIAIDDVVEYLVAALDADVGESRIYEIGGADRISYRALLEAYAKRVGRTVPTLSLPVPDPPLSVVDLPDALGRAVPERLRSGVALIESLRYQTVAADEAARADFGIEPLGVDEALDLALST